MIIPTNFLAVRGTSVADEGVYSAPPWLLGLIREEGGPRSRQIFIAASLAGAANLLLLFLVNQAAQAGGAKLPQVLGILVALIMYVLCARRTFQATREIIESALYKAKLRIVERVNRAEFKQIEGMGTAEIYDRLTENVSVISDSAGFVAHLLQSICIVLLAAIYVASLSSTGVALLIVINTMGIGLYAGNNLAIAKALKTSAAVRVEFIDRLTDLLKGMKEIRFSRRREAEVAEDLSISADQLRMATIDSNTRFDNNYILAQSYQFFSAVAIVGILPSYADISGETLLALVTGFLFLWGPLGGVVNGAPMLMRSNRALANIQELEQRLDRSDADAGETALPVGPFTSLVARDLCFEYVGAGGTKQFAVGPMNLEIRAGEVVFIVGGNGSGKSTFLKLLTGLYSPSSGQLLVNGEVVEASQRAAYRELFSTIFGDFHLFNRLYGLPDVTAADVNPLLRRMQLDHKTTFAHNRFTSRDLSTGQRKRLAMIVTLLEDRPIVVFDEWAADQDPEFRKYFYEELVPSFKQRGVTVLAVTHDDRYFHCADRVVSMEYGQLRSVDAPR